MKCYVTELIGDEYLNWNSKSSYLISTPTGSGKTTFVIKQLLKHAIQQRKHMVYICNRRVLNDQFTVQADRKIADIFQEEDSITAKMAGEYLHICTYQNLENARIFPSIWIDVPCSDTKCILMGDEILYYVFDEAHYMVSDAAFNSKTNFWVDSIFKCYTPFSIFVYLTATPDPLIAFIHSYDILSIRSQEDLYRRFSERRKHFGEADAFIQDQVLQILCNFAKKSKKADLSLMLPSMEIIVKHVKAACDSTLNCLYQELSNALHNPETHPACTTRKPLHIYTYEPDYSYITPIYFKKYEHLIEEIKTTSGQKWLIFIDNEADGKDFKEKLVHAGTDVEDIGFLSRHEINTNHQAQEIYNSIVTTESYPCRVLITTSVLDCGINIHDNLVTNIVIASDNKTSFLQMLGRRIDEGEQIRLYIKAYSYQSINTRYRKYKKEIRTLNLLSLKNRAVGNSFLPQGMLSSICNSFNSMPNHLWYTAVNQIEREITDSSVFIQEKGVKLNNIDLILHGIEYSKTGFLYRLLQLQEYEPAIKQYRTFSSEFRLLLNYICSCVEKMNEIFDDPKHWPDILTFNDAPEPLQHTIPDQRDALIQQYKKLGVQKISDKTTPVDSFYLDQQLSWIGKTYDENCWFRSRMSAMINFIESHANGQLLEPETFSKEFLALVRELPTIPSSIKKDISRYKDGKTLPKKNKIEKALKELNLNYKIESVQKSVDKKRITFWYLKRIFDIEFLTEPPHNPL